MIGAIRTAVIIGLLLLATSGESSTWFVERDGSGDYTTIQAAVNSAASGDTIRIGPGRFNEGEVIETPGWTEYVRVLVRQEELTFIGAGSSETIIGPNMPWDLSAGLNKGIEASPYWGNQLLVVEGIRFENIGQAIRGLPAPEFVVKDCSFYGNYYSVFSVEGTLSVENCDFVHMPRNGYFIYSSQDDILNVSDCTFELDPVHPWYQTAVHVQSVTTAFFNDCSFLNGSTGAAFVGVANASAVGCLFGDQLNHGIACTDGTNLTIGDSVFTGTNQAFYIYGFSTDVTMRNTKIFDVVDASIKLDSIGALSVQDCILDRGQQWTIYQSWPCTKSGDLPHLDMTNNDWGTTCADSIEAWIEVCDYIVDYVPLRRATGLVRECCLGRREGHVQGWTVAVNREVSRPLSGSTTSDWPRILRPPHTRTPGQLRLKNTTRRQRAPGRVVLPARSAQSRANA